MEAHNIVKAVHNAYKKIPDQMAKVTGKTDELYRSHGREPKTHNPLQSGNCSPVTHYMTYVRQHEAAVRGAGKLMNSRVHAALDAEFAEQDLLEVTQGELHVDVIEETSDVEKWLAKFDLNNAGPQDLTLFIEECAQAIEAISQVQSRAAARKKLIGLRTA